MGKRVNNKWWESHVIVMGMESEEKNQEVKEELKESRKLKDGDIYYMEINGKNVRCRYESLESKLKRGAFRFKRKGRRRRK